MSMSNECFVYDTYSIIMQPSENYLSYRKPDLAMNRRLHVRSDDRSAVFRSTSAERI
jgi:hypothetical protein